MSKNLRPIVFDPSRFERELKAFGALLKSKPGLSERDDIQPFFEKSKHLSAYMGTFAPDIGPATEIAFNFSFFGDYSADVLLGNTQAGEFCVIEFEDGRPDSLFKKSRGRANPEWSARFEHGFSQLVDWFYTIADFSKTQGFTKTFGYGHIRFIGMLVAGRNSGLDDALRNRLKWRTERVLIDSHRIYCVTFDELHELLQYRFNLYKGASKLERP